MDQLQFEDLLFKKSYPYVFKEAHQTIKEFYTDFKGFYAKNFFNNKETELYYFLADSVVKVEFNYDSKLETYKFPYKIRQYKSKINRKDLTYADSEVELTLELEDNTIFYFNSKDDSNEKWQESYAENIISIFKVI